MAEHFFSQPMWLQLLEVWSLFVVVIVLPAVRFIIDSLRD